MRTLKRFLFLLISPFNEFTVIESHIYTLYRSSSKFYVILVSVSGFWTASFDWIILLDRNSGKPHPAAENSRKRLSDRDQ